MPAGVGDPGGGRGQHRLDEPADREADLLEPRLPLAQRDSSNTRQLAAEHGGAAHRGQRHVCRLGDRVGDDTGEGSHHQVAEEHSRMKTCSGSVA